MKSNLKDKIDFIKNKTKLILSNWNFDYLGNVAIIKMGQSPSSSSYNEEGIGKYLIQGNADIFNRKSSPRIWTSKPTKTCEIGETLMTVRAPVGAVAKALHSACIGRGMCSINSVKINNEFLYQFLLSYENSWKRIEQGSTFTAISGNDIKKVIIPLPPLKEQQKIAQILSQWDEAIETTQNLITQLQLRKKGLMQELLSGKKRLAGFSEEWKEIKLGDITSRITKKNTELNDTVITISAQRGFVRQEDFFKKRVASKTLSGYYLIEKGHFAYNKSYSNGYPMGAFKRLDTLEKAVVTTLYICFEAKDNVDSDFLLSYFEGGMITKNLTRIAQEGGRAHGLLNIGINDFFGLKLTVPSLTEQKEISKVLNTVDEEISSKISYLDNLKQQKKGLMQQLLTGQKRVKVN